MVVRKVALRKESVDRNTLEWQQQAPQAVALRKSVDKFVWEARKQAGLTVALRKESVDRNIPAFRLCDVLSTVALRKERRG